MDGRQVKLQPFLYLAMKYDFVFSSMGFEFQNVEETLVGEQLVQPGRRGLPGGGAEEQGGGAHHLPHQVGSDFPFSWCILVLKLKLRMPSRFDSMNPYFRRFSDNRMEVGMLVNNVNASSVFLRN